MENCNLSFWIILRLENRSSNLDCFWKYHWNVYSVDLIRNRLNMFASSKYMIMCLLQFSPGTPQLPPRSKDMQLLRLGSLTLDLSRVYPACPPPPHPVWWECITTSQMFLHTHPFTVVFSVSPKRVLCPFWHFNSLFWASSHTATLFQYIFLPWNYLIWLSPWAPTNSFLLSITNSSAFCFLWENLTLICYLSCQWCFFKCFIYVKTENEEKYYLLWK